MSTSATPQSQEMHPDQLKFIEACSTFLSNVANLTPGPTLEARLNTEYGPSSATHQHLTTLIKSAITTSPPWFANIEITGPSYRRSLIAPPSASTHYFSITAVYFNTPLPEGLPEGHSPPPSSQNTTTPEAPPEGPASPPNLPVFRGQYHAHPYGEINFIVPLTPNAQIKGPNGWCGHGWTCPGPGSEHFPEARGGEVVAVFFLPAGRISYLDGPEGGK